MVLKESEGFVVKRNIGLLAILLLLLIPVFSNADIINSGECGDNGDNVTWTIDDAGVLTISGNGAIADSSHSLFGRGFNTVIIEPGITRIGNCCFYYDYHSNSDIKAITIPNTVTSIGYQAFGGCTGIKSITIPNSVVEIGGTAFVRCESLEEVTIPSSVSNLDSGVFYYCSHLKTVNIQARVGQIDFTELFCQCNELTDIVFPSDHRTYQSIDGVVYSKDGTTLIYCPRGKMGAFIMPSTVEAMLFTAFSDRLTKCRKLSTIQMHKSISIIDSPDLSDHSANGLFFDCCNAGVITIPDISNYHFRAICCECSNLKSVTIPDTITKISEFAFTNCINLTSVLIPENIISIEKEAFQGCISLKNIDLQNSRITRIEDSAFMNCGLIEVTLPINITYLGENCFDKTVLLHVPEGSYAEQWAYDNYYDYVTYHVHKPIIDPAIDPTCTGTGLTEGEHCELCEEILIAQEVIPALGHTEVTDAAVATTCTETGLTEGKHCSVCEAVLVEQEIVPALGHTEVIDAAVAATCTETGLTEGKHCSVCEAVLVEQETVPALGHDFQLTEEIPAEVGKEGLKAFTCSRCEETMTETIPALKPTPEPTTESTLEPTVEPTTNPTPEPTAEPAAEPTPEPTAAPTAEPTDEPTAAPVPAVLPGDVTDDGKVNIMDVIRLLKKVSGWDVTIKESAADVTGDGNINIMDVIRLLKYVSGWDVKLS